ncbi:MAG: DUF3696 domain-containing protein [Rikenellaceae bacterium]
MITNIRIGNFKLHENTSIDLGNLTILTGMNGMGKSSIIQALLLLRQSDVGAARLNSLNLKGELCDIGASGGLACQASASHNFEVGIKMGNGTKYDFAFEYPDDIYDTELKAIDPTIDLSGDEKCPIFTADFQYIGAFRFGPQKSYNRDTNIVKTKRQISKEMGQCEYVIHYLDQYKSETIPIEELASPMTTNGDLRLLSQVELWMRLIAPNIKIYVEPMEESFKLNYKFIREESIMTDSISAINTGFGITYVLPIVVAVLSARRGSIILIENPEAHIHPKGQAVLMSLLALAAKNGVQIIIETHSDHIVNGALVSIVEKTITADMLSVYFFDRDEGNHTSTSQKLLTTEKGRIKNPPKDFFDQIDLDLKTIMGF